MVRDESLHDPTDGQRRKDQFDRDRFHGVVAVLVGLSQLPLALSFPPDDSLPAFVVGSAGMLLVAIGTNLLRGRAAFASGWGADGAAGPVGTAVLAVLTAAVVVASVVWTLP